MGEDERPRRLLSDLSTAIRKDPLIDEFGFIFSPEPVCNKSPILLEQHKLGIETWSIKILYPFVHRQLVKVKPLASDTKFLHECSQAAVLLNAECYTAWNIRKHLVLKKALSAESDLKLATLVLTKHPKSSETFAQRRWLLQHIFPDIKPSHQSEPTNLHYYPLNNQHPDPPNGLGRLVQNGALGNLERIVEGEMIACTIAANRYPNNYNAWSHRIWVLKYLARGLVQVLQSEWFSSKGWVNGHISDHSGFHYRQFLMQSLKEHRRNSISRKDKGNSSGAMDLVEEELQFTANLISFYPGHEAIWYHRRFVIHFWRTMLREKISATNSEPLSHHDITVMEDLPAPNVLSSWQEKLPATTTLPSASCGESQMDTDPEPSVPAKQRLLSPEQCGKERSIEEELATIATSEINFADAVRACTPHGDIEAQKRCVDNYKRWLQNE